MTFSGPRAKSLKTIGIVALLLFASGHHALAQSEELESAVERSTAFGQRMFHGTVPVAIGWFNGQPCLYISTDASEPAVAAAFKANYAPGLANAPSPAPIYAITNFAQGNIVPSAPQPAGPGNTSKGYTPLWQVNMVTWNSGVTPQLLRSEQDVLAMQTAGNLTVTKTNVIVNCTIVWTLQGGALPGTTISMTTDGNPGSTSAMATMPLVVGWFNGQHVLYLSPDASDTGAGGPTANFSSLLGASANSNAAVPIYAVTNFKQGNVIPSAPLPTGPTSSASSGYSPLWQVNMVTWKSGVTPTVLKSSADVQAAQQAGNVTITKANIIVNCPVIYTPLGGLLPGATVTSSEN